MKRNRLIPILLPFCFFASGCNSRIDYQSKLIIIVSVVSIIILLFLGLAFYSNILRDEVSNCQEFDENALKLQKQQRTKISRSNPFSLTRVQFGLWTVVISSSYIYLALYKGDCNDNSISKTAMVLMGIFSATAAASTIIDKREMIDNRPRHQNTPSQGFFIDILSDDNGISLHRFQNFVWTLIAITIYLYKVSLITEGCALPELSNTLLGLTGISSATYLVLRSQENDPAVVTAQNAAQNTPAMPQADPVAVTAQSTIPQSSPLPHDAGNQQNIFTGTNIITPGIDIQPPGSNIPTQSAITPPVATPIVIIRNSTPLSGNIPTESATPANVLSPDAGTISTDHRNQDFYG